MKESRLHTPDGVRDIYNGECQKKLVLQDKLHQVLTNYGYQDIQTPTIEFFNIFSQDIGTKPSKDLYKFFDKEGNTLVLRPDFTPSIARSAAKYYSEEKLPVKLCYIGNTFVNSTNYQLKLKESTQCGAELMGDPSSSADAEIISMIISALKNVGLEEFRITIGHALFLPALLSVAEISDDLCEQIYEYLNNKNYFGVEDLISDLSLSDDLKALFALIGSYDLSMDELTKAKRIAKNYEDIYKALDDLESVYDQLKLYGIDNYVSFELGIVSSFHYYTGIIFAGYTFGTGEAIVNGGRYDKLLSYFGKNTPAIGFAIEVDRLMAALSRQKIEIPIENKGTLLVYKKENRKSAIEKANKLRSQNEIIEILKFDADITEEDYRNYASSKNYASVEFMI